jgi:hypothetical protein
MFTEIVILEYPARTTVRVHILPLSIKFRHLGLGKCIVFTDYIMYYFILQTQSRNLWTKDVNRPMQQGLCVENSG